MVVVAGCASLHRSATPRGPTDANIAAMLLAANNTDISYAELAPTRADRSDVKEFAQRMLTDHTGVNQAINTLLAQINLTPEDNIASLDMRDESATKRDIMRELSGHAFDSVTIDSVLAPSARNPQLKQLIAGVRPAVAAHLEHAQRVQAAVGGQ
jgi:putative membrane protein